MSGQLEPYDYTDRTPEELAALRDVYEQLRDRQAADLATTKARLDAIALADRAPPALVVSIDETVARHARTAAETVDAVWPHVQEMNSRHEFRPGKGAA